MNTPTKNSAGRGAEKLALATYTKLMRAAESVTARTSRQMAAADLTVSQFGVLEALYHKGPLCQRDIALKILKSTGNMTMVIDNLEKRGLVTRERDAQDRRYLTVHLTPAGNELIAATFTRVAAAITAEIGILHDEEQLLLGRLCRIIGRRERGDGID
jgi:MarR family transcriptional regulator, 2-MHQ and catechol-resistance regulon repressor